MKIFFSTLHFGVLRNFELAVSRLAERGHQIRLLADEPDTFGGQELAEELAARFPTRLTWGFAPSYDRESWFPVARKIRYGIDYLRFLEEPFISFPKLHERLVERVPRGLLWMMSVPLVNTETGRRIVRNGLVALDSAMPRNPAMDAFLEAERPDLLLLASVTNTRSPQLDHLRSATALGVRTGVCVYSWDHLSSKALIRQLPDRVLLWNDTQKREAVELHGVPAERVVVTGAQCYDRLFEWRSNRTRADFAVSVGLPSDRPYLFYVCSALTPDPRESEFVRDWLRAIRQSTDERLRKIGVLIRPHPERRSEWEHADLSGLDPVVVRGGNPINTDAKADYYDALVHSDAVVGLVTSAFLEAAIVGRPVLTLLHPDLRQHQEGMRHFRYLLDVEGGLLQVARDFDEHLVHLSSALDGTHEWTVQQQRFLRAFVRPRGLDVPATTDFVEAVEAIGVADEPVSSETPVVPWFMPILKSIIVTSEHSLVLRPLLLDGREVAEEYRRGIQLKEHKRAKRRRKRERRQDRAARRRTKLEERAHTYRAAHARKAEIRRRKQRDKRTRVWSKRVDRMLLLGSLIRKRIGI